MKDCSEKFIRFAILLVAIHCSFGLSSIVVAQRAAAKPSPQPQGPTLRIFDWEINQGLRDYQLVAGKDTLARVFVGIGIDTSQGPTLPPVAPTVRIDTAKLIVRRAGGTEFTIDGEIPHHDITNLSQQYSEDMNVNFYLNGSQLPAGDYEFTAQLFRSKVLLAEIDFGAIYTLAATKELNLLLGFIRDPRTGLDLTGRDFDLSADTVLWPYVKDQILGTVSRLFPISSGVQQIVPGRCVPPEGRGLGYYIYLDGVENDPVRQLDALNRYNLMLSVRGGMPLGDCPHADRIVSMGRSADNGGADFVMGKEGGNGDLPGGRMDGRTVRLGIALNPFNSMQGKGDAGMIASQEIGHNFGLVPLDRDDGTRHSPIFYIADSTAFNMKQKNSIAPRRTSDPANPLDFTCLKPFPLKFTTGPSSVMASINNNECVLFETMDWNFLRTLLLPSNFTTTTTVSPVFYLVGTISSADSFTKLDSRLLPPNSPTDPVVNGAYNIVFLNRDRNELGRTGFNLNASTGHGEPTTDNPFSIAQPFPAGAIEAQLRHNNTIIATVRRSETPPRVRIAKPLSGEVFRRDTPNMLIEWTGDDPDGDSLTYTLSFSNDGGNTFSPIGTVFGPTTRSYLWNTSLAPFTGQGVIRVEASDGFNVASALSGTFEIKSAAFDVCLQDESNGNSLRFNSITGEYQFAKCGPNGITITGIGSLSRIGCVLQLLDITSESNSFAINLRAELNTCSNSGTASIQLTPEDSFTIADINTSNNTCTCP